MKSKSNKTEYAAKLKDPRWQKLRLQVFSRDDWKCTCCDSRENTLHVHHKYYDWDKDPWLYELDSLVTLCELCHDEEGECIKGSLIRLERAMRMKFFGGQIDMIADGFWEMENPQDPEAFAIAFMRAFTKDKELINVMIKKHHG